MLVKELIEHLKQYDDNDPVVLSTCDEDGDEIDLFDFYMDEIRNCEDDKGNPFTEVRICQLPHKADGHIADRDVVADLQRLRNEIKNSNE